MKTIPAKFLWSLYSLSCSLAICYGQVRFTENKGQISDQFFRPRQDVLFAASNGSMVCHFMRQGYSLQLNRTLNHQPCKKGALSPADFAKATSETLEMYRLDVRWLGAFTNPQITPGRELAGYENFFLEVCPSGITGVRSFEEIYYSGIYKGVDLRFYNHGGHLKYDYILRPGADYRQIKWTIAGATKILLDGSGNLVIRTPLGDVSEARPLVHQNGEVLDACWVVEDSIVSFRIKNVNPRFELVIDPLVRLWGTYYGGSGYDEFAYSCVDYQGNLYMSGRTSSSGAQNIATVGSYQFLYGGGGGPGLNPGDGLLVKMSPTGQRLWATYYGGSGIDDAGACATDASGNVFLAGATNSTNSAVFCTPGAYQTSLNINGSGSLSDAYMVKFDPQGNRMWATYYGDFCQDWAWGASVDRNGDLFICGISTYSSSTQNLMGSLGSHQPQHAQGTDWQDAFLAKFSGSNGQRIWGTYYGGTSWDGGWYCNADTLGNVYMVGATTSTNALMIATTGAYQINYAGGSQMGDGFLVKFNANGVRQWSTYYGQQYDDQLVMCALGPDNQVVVFGATSSTTGSLLATPGSWQPNYGGGSSDAIVAKFSQSGQRLWATYYGGSGYEEANIGTVSKNGNVFITGRTSVGSGSLMATCDTYQNNHGGGVNDCYLAKFNSNGNRIWSTYFGGAGNEPVWSGVVTDASENIYLAGTLDAGTAASVVSTPAGFQTSYGGGPGDIFLQKFAPCTPSPPVLISGYNACIGQPAVLQSTLSCGLKWYSDPALQNLVYAGGIFTTNILFSDTTFYVTDESCGITSPAAAVQLTAALSPTVNIFTSALPVCAGESVMLFATGADTYSWTGLSSSYSISVSPSASGIYTVTGYLQNGCKSTATVQVLVESCTGINTDEKPGQLWFSPNPVRDWLLLGNRIEFMSIMTMDGRTLGSSTEVISTLQNGCYLLCLKNDTEVKIFKLVLLR